jgi:hypothetical protein
VGILNKNFLLKLNFEKISSLCHSAMATATATATVDSLE